MCAAFFSEARARSSPPRWFRMSAAACMSRSPLGGRSLDAGNQAGPPGVSSGRRSRSSAVVVSLSRSSPRMVWLFVLGFRVCRGHLELESVYLPQCILGKVWAIVRAMKGEERLKELSIVLSAALRP